ncbi:YceD family protein [Salinicoccus albus]|uniref:YceD family protein n=1 Tax=Salinicoccus albus TaxID=418756 RepID=UPI000373EAD5|nr:YceD family protein [Salinicoccus albus]
MKWSLTQLKKFKEKGMSVNEKIQFKEITDRTDVLSFNETSVKGDMDVGHRRIGIELTIDTVVNMLDSRTSEDIEVPLHIESYESFDEDVEETDELDENVHPVIHTLDLEPVVRELIVVNIPNFISESDEVPAGGRDWTVTDEEALAQEKAQKVDPRLSKLQSLLPESDNGNKED